MSDKILRKIQKVLQQEQLTRYDYLNLANYFQRLYIETSVQDNIIRVIDNMNNMKLK